MILIIAEKPSLGRNIAAALGVNQKAKGCLLGEKYIVTWAFGHLFSLCDLEDYQEVADSEKKSWNLEQLPCFPKEFRFQLRGTSSKKKKTKKNTKSKSTYGDEGIAEQFAVIEALCRREDVTQIVNAGDADREGEIIVRLILQHALAQKDGKPAIEKPLFRLWLPDQTEQTIRRAVENMQSQSAYDNLANEGFARTYVDWLYGVNLTRYASVRTGTLLRVGRVIVPIVRAIYDRDMAIRNFVATPYISVVSKEKTNGQLLEMTSSHEFDGDDAGKAGASELCNRYNRAQAKVTSVKQKETVLASGKLYSLSVLQSALGKKYKMSMERSLAILQKLYEEGYITYPRTNSEYLATAEKEKIGEILEKIRVMGYDVVFKDNKKIFDDSKIESHSALTPTYKIPDKNRLTEEEMQVYSMIFRRFAAVFCAEDCIAEKTEVKVSLFEGEDVLEVFTLRGTVIRVPGWMKYDDAPKNHKILPLLSEGDLVKVNFQPVDKKTKPPEHYTIETLNNYLKNPFKEDKAAAKKAAQHESEDEGDPDDAEDYRAIFEGLELGTEATRTGIIDNARKSKYIQLKKDVYTILPDGEFLIQSLEKMEISMDKYKTSTLGRSLKRVYRGKDSIKVCVMLAEKEISEILSKKDTTTVTRVPFQPKSGSKGKSSRTKPSGPAIRIGKCPLCGNDIVRGSFAYGCLGYKNGCNFRVGTHICEREITPEEVYLLIMNGKTPLLQGFISKKKTPFAAYLVLDGERVNLGFEHANKTAIFSDSCDAPLPADPPPPRGSEL